MAFRGIQSTNIISTEVGFTDPVLILNKDGSTSVDVGFLGKIGSTSYAGLVKDSSTEDFLLIKSISINSSSVNDIDATDLSLVKGNLQVDTVTGDLIGDVTGQVSSISNFNTDSLSEGASNLYYTDARVSTYITGDRTYGNITMESTEDSSDAGPIIELKRDITGSDANYIGQVKFTADNDADQSTVFAKITGKILDASDGTEDGIIEFAHKKAGTNVITGRWRSDSLQLLNSTNLSVDGDTTLNGTLNGHTIPSGSGTIALTSGIPSSTDGLSEGSNNLYFTNDRSRSAISGGTGITYASGVISIGQDVANTANVTFNNIAVDGNISKGSGNLAINPASGQTLVYYNGSLKLETTSAGITVTGAITASGDITAFSDDTLKTNVQVIDNAVSKVEQLRGVTFDRIEDGSTSTGVIAQELKEVLPEAVHTNEQGLHSVAYGNVVGLLIEAIKEQQKQIDTLIKNNQSNS